MEWLYDESGLLSYLLTDLLTYLLFMDCCYRVHLITGCRTTGMKNTQHFTRCVPLAFFSIMLFAFFYSM